MSVWCADAPMHDPEDAGNVLSPQHAYMQHQQHQQQVHQYQQQQQQQQQMQTDHQQTRWPHKQAQQMQENGMHAQPPGADHCQRYLAAFADLVQQVSAKLGQALDYLAHLSNRVLGFRV